jgi:hypothetical protein
MRHPLLAPHLISVARHHGSKRRVRGRPLVLPTVELCSMRVVGRRLGPMSDPSFESGGAPGSSVCLGIGRRPVERTLCSEWLGKERLGIRHHFIDQVSGDAVIVDVDESAVRARRDENSPLEAREALAPFDRAIHWCAPTIERIVQTRPSTTLADYSRPGIPGSDFQ